tara:strand:+ start:3969 stop:4373 length:405 start_codon:yes stop_codon:yes gene_type:complete
MITAKVQIVFATCYPKSGLDNTSNHTMAKEVSADNIEMLLEKTFMLQGNNLEGSKYWGDEFYSLSVGDTVWVSIEGQRFDVRHDGRDDTLWIVCPMGFAKMTMRQAWKWEQTKREDRYWMARDIYKANVEPTLV